MKYLWLAAGVMAMSIHLPAYAINARYAQKLEHSGCTQVSELQGCDINKTKLQNARAGFVANTSKPVAPTHSPETRWVARTADGAIVANIRVDGSEHVWVNDKSAKVKRQNGLLEFHSGTIAFTLKNDLSHPTGQWFDSDAGTRGPIIAQ